MYLEFFGLKDTPFSIAPNPRFLFMSQKHREALAHLLYGVQSGGFILLTGEVGTGKTTICRCFLEQVPDNTDVAFIFNPKLTVHELLANICDELEIGYYKDDISVKDYIDYLNTHLLDAHAEGRKTILIIDEAQNLSVEVLEQLRLLTNLETNQEKLLQIILIGQPELRDMFDQKELRQLSQRITARFHLDHLSPGEVQEYIKHRLRVAGTQIPVFPPRTVKRVYQLSGGIPRLINVICDRSLLGAYVQEKHQVDVNTVNRAAKEVLGTQYPDSYQSKPIKVAVAALLVLALGAMGWWQRDLFAPTQDAPLLAGNTEAVANGAGPSSANQANKVKPPAAIPSLPTLPKASKPDMVEAGVADSGSELSQAALASKQSTDTQTEAAIEPDGESRSETAPASQTELAAQQTDAVQTAQAQLPDTSALSGQASQKTNNDAATTTDAGASISWPQDLDSTASLYAAFSALFQEWRMTYRPNDHGGDPCQYAESKNMACLQHQDSLELLLTLDRPAVLKLFPENREYLYGVLLAVNGDELELQVGEQPVRLTKTQLKQVWRGDYTLIWKRPPVYHGVIQPNMIGPPVKWLSNRLKDLNYLEQGDGISSFYDENMQQTVRRFQQQMGLQADGIVGARTYIKLNTAAGDAVPLLAKRATTTLP